MAYYFKLFSSLPLCFSVFFFVLASCSLALQDQPQQNLCQFERLDTLKPDNVVRSEAGRIETWDPNQKQLQCVGVALFRCVLEQHGLRLPSYSNSPQLIYITRGRGVVGMVIPGCRNTYEESRIVIRKSVVSNQKEEVHAIHLLHTTNHQNQLDPTPRIFYLAGNQKQEFSQYQSGRRQQEPEEEEEEGEEQRWHPKSGRGWREPSRGRREGEQEGQEQEQQGRGNVIGGFGSDMVKHAFNADDDETVENLRGQDDQREGNIIRVEGGLKLSIFKPTVSEQQGEEEEDLEDEQGGGSENGLEETLCSLRLKQNIGKTTSPDMYHPQAGSLRTVNSLDLSVLKMMGLSAEFGSLHNGAIYVPHYTLNAHSIVCAVEGRANIQVVDSNGNTVSNQELSAGQVMAVPQNFAVAIRSQSEHFLWVAFKTNHLAMVATLPGQIQAWPEEVVERVYRLSGGQARNLKNNSPLLFLVPPRQSTRAVA
ncbi:conglutin alpha 1-like [Neltuma alba]|uniref:conglutin alpha 1-like n=1 Tax=Neltuma alba TaxID=207710 RepID=UPI0010A36EF6|nr:conglutin alpha 1-like [Prosopis alba]